MSEVLFDKIICDVLCLAVKECDNRYFISASSSHTPYRYDEDLEFNDPTFADECVFELGEYECFLREPSMYWEDIWAGSFGRFVRLYTDSDKVQYVYYPLDHTADVRSYIQHQWDPQGRSFWMLFVEYKTNEYIKVRKSAHTNLVDVVNQFHVFMSGGTSSESDSTAS